MDRCVSGSFVTFPILFLILVVLFIVIVFIASVMTMAV